MKGGYNMKSNTKTARVEIKKLVDTIGIDNILNEHINDIMERTGVSVIDCQNAISYYKYRCLIHF